MTKVTPTLREGKEIAERTIAFCFGIDWEPFVFKPGQCIRITLLNPSYKDKNGNYGAPRRDRQRSGDARQLNCLPPARLGRHATRCITILFVPADIKSRVVGHTIQRVLRGNSQWPTTNIHEEKRREQ